MLFDKLFSKDALNILSNDGRKIQVDFAEGKDGEEFEQNDLTEKDDFLKKFPLRHFYSQKEYLQSEKSVQVQQDFPTKEQQEKYVIQFPTKKSAMTNYSYYKTG